jgi:hypothetical protein
VTPHHADEREPTMPTPLRTVSYGGGVQSTALLVLAAQRVIDFPTFLMANVGDDSEHPATLAYVRDVAGPYAAENGIDLHLIDRKMRDGTTRTLWQELMREDLLSIPIPVRLSNGAPGTRSCTVTYKIRLLGQWLKTHGATADNPAVVAIGISLDEIGRANADANSEKYRSVVYPLLDLRLRRTDCERIIADAGLPVPPKSSCFFCPFHRMTVWQDMRRDEPELFEKSAALEDTLNERRTRLGRDNVYLTRFNAPLRDVVPDNADLLPFADDDPADGECDSGVCFT